MVTLKQFVTFSKTLNLFENQAKKQKTNKQKQNSVFNGPFIVYEIFVWPINQTNKYEPMLPILTIKITGIYGVGKY